MSFVSRLMLVALLAAGMTLMACGADPASSGGTKTDAGTSSGDSGTTDADTDATGGDTETDTTGTDETTDTGTGDTDTDTTDDPTTDTTGTDTTGGTETTGGPVCDLPTEYSDYSTHFYTLQLVVDPGNYGCDSNGDNTIDKQDGLLNDALVGPASLLKLAGQDVNATFAESVEDGSLIFLAEIAGYTGETTKDATINMYIGAPIEEQPDPACGIFEKALDSCEWLIGVSSFDDSCTPLISIPNASITDGALSAGPYPFVFTFDLGGLPLPLTVDQGKFVGDIDGKFDLTNGRICGVVPQEAIVAAMNAACPGTPDDPALCSFKDLLPLAITCKECSVVLEADGVENTSLALEPIE